jgi:hypothetical protein
VKAIAFGLIGWKYPCGLELVLGVLLDDLPLYATVKVFILTNHISMSSLGVTLLEKEGGKIME